MNKLIIKLPFALIIFLTGLFATTIVLAEPFNAETLVRLDRVGSPVLSPDGSKVVYTLRTTDMATNKGVYDLWWTAFDDPALNHALEKLQQARKNRNPAIISRLNELGISISLDEVRELAGDAQLGRPHIAQMMISKGVVSSIDEAFDQFLGADKPAYVDKYRVECSKAINAIRGAGGIPVLAHPGLLEYENEDQLNDLLGQLKQMGIEGVEVYYSEHSAEQTRLFAELARRHNLLMTGGTDFHGSIQPEINIGSGKGDLFVPYELYEKLIRPA